MDRREPLGNLAVLNWPAIFPSALRLSKDVLLITRHVPLFVALTIQIFMYCTAGQYIATQTISVADAVYDSNWFVKNQPRLRKSLSMVMQRSQKTAKITALGVWTLDMRTFVSVLQTAFSLFTFMQTMNRFGGDN